MMSINKVSSVITLFVALTATNVGAQSGDDPERIIHTASNEQSSWKQQLRNILNHKADGWVVRYNDNGTAEAMIVDDIDLRSFCERVQSISQIDQLIVSDSTSQKVSC